MAIQEKLNTLNDEREQRNKAFQARALLQEVREKVLEADTELQAIADSGSFDTIDTEIKDVMLAAWNVVKSAKTSFEDENIVTLLNWST